ncbi:SDR family oxidoreductase [Runella sp. MFBS21]|uniref:SDR family oxidoreductase n=1 Tax=Runella sp. MFBS21 TaxID=3034018 RepID=UPI0023FA12C3|nr:SDR family oxidoreductase [Runella sp. MFBS21]MDF7819811.1 SDR family oxidoreductase [Runella sp. MFBS21]
MQKTVLITGTSTGIGRAAAIHFAKNNWNVVATMRNPKSDTELIKIPNILVTALDVTNPTSITEAINLGIGQFGKIDAVVNNAGYGQQGLFEAVSPEKIQAQFDTNVFGVMNVIRGLLPHFRSNKGGVIVNISSGIGKIATPITSIYTASKFAIEGFSEALAYELDSQNIKVKVVEPGFIKTPFYERAGKEFAFIDESLLDYQKFSDDMALFFKGFESIENLFTAEDVAKVTYEAANDQSNRLRFIAGSDVEPLIEIRNSKPEEEYLQTIRSIFYPSGFKL